ncbi:glutamine amidotransferase [Rothia terrae]|uniref:Lipid II isoglutaminyl synthase (glutamine-hydrolyzing) subunit GatD n=1 Tax=Rothia terrae TaxID=396015 RepID=A0A7H2BAY3_9MICC|nr:glutamine amidotransferase [Rothia terrae]MDT0188865.1 glutamine amidotransferase [Rothia terrae]NKZ33402.1 glutamine amidotransferase [Rothia terrae]QNV36829.1 glutamine amidotransferase [Rothia terrae]
MTAQDKKSLTIVQLYPKDMNIYGDWGNTLSLSRRAQAHGFDTEIIDYNPGDEFLEHADIIVGGGGQDSGQTIIQDDLLAIGDRLKAMAKGGTPMLVICGLYQLFGKEFRTIGGENLTGIGIFDLITEGGEERLIGNIVEESDEFGTIVGYENHSGLTHLGDGVTALATVTKGEGNNRDDKKEGARVHNVIGSYLHGPLLPKNPKISDFLISKAAEKKYGEFTPATIDDSLVEKARAAAIERPR